MKVLISDWSIALKVHRYTVVKMTDVKVHPDDRMNDTNVDWVHKNGPTNDICKNVKLVHVRSSAHCANM